MTSAAAPACPRRRDDPSVNRTRELRVLLDLARALLSSRPARIRFRDTARRTSERIVDVLALGFDPPRWIAAAWSAELGSLRLLDVSRVRSVRKARRRTAGLPTGFDPQHFATRRWFDARAPASARTIPATLAPPWSGVAEALLPGARVVRDGAGNASVRVRASRPDVVVSLLASLPPIGAID